jgi:hypothetical protein
METQHSREVRLILLVTVTVRVYLSQVLEYRTMLWRLKGNREWLIKSVMISLLLSMVFCTILKVTVLGLHSDACFVLICELRVWKVERVNTLIIGNFLKFCVDRHARDIGSTCFSSTLADTLSAKWTHLFNSFGGITWTAVFTLRMSPVGLRCKGITNEWTDKGESFFGPTDD